MGAVRGVPYADASVMWLFGSCWIGGAVINCLINRSGEGFQVLLAGSERLLDLSSERGTEMVAEAITPAAGPNRSRGDPQGSRRACGAGPNDRTWSHHAYPPARPESARPGPHARPGSGHPARHER